LSRKTFWHNNPAENAAPQVMASNTQAMAAAAVVSATISKVAVPMAARQWIQQRQAALAMS